MTHLAMDCSVRELCDAVVGGVGYGPAFGVCDAGGTAWSECLCVVSPFRDQSQDGLQVAEPCQIGPDGSVGPFAAATVESAAHAEGDGGFGSGGAIGPSVLGWTQDRSPAGRSGRDGCTGAIDGDGDPAAPWRRLGAGRDACHLPALRALCGRTSSGRWTSKAILPWPRAAAIR